MEYEHEAEPGYEAPVAGDPLDEPILPLEEPGAEPPQDPMPSPADALHGEEEPEFWEQQSENGFCVPMSVTMVLREFGVEVSELEVVSRAYENGWLAGQPGNWQGMPPAQAEDLLESYGVPAHLESYPDPTQAIDALRTRLDAGVDAILAIDSSEVWDRVDDDLTLGGERLDHAVVVTEIDDEAGTVTLNDPGHPEGAGMVVDLALFTDAWEDSDFQMVVTDEAPIAQLPSEPQELPQPAPEVPLPQPIPIGPDTGTPATEPVGEPIAEPVGEPIAEPVADTPADESEDGDGAGGEALVIGAAGLILLPVYLIAREAQARGRKRRETT